MPATPRLRLAAAGLLTALAAALGLGLAAQHAAAAQPAHHRVLADGDMKYHC